MTHSSGNKPCKACNACRDKHRKKVLHVAGEGGRPLCKSKRTEYPLIEGRFETWVAAKNRCQEVGQVGWKGLQGPTESAGLPGPRECSFSLLRKVLA